MKRCLFLCIFTLFIIIPGFGAIIYVPSFELISRGIFEEGEFVINSLGDMDLELKAGDKFGGKVVLGFVSDNLETDILSPDGVDGLGFKGADVTVQNLFSLPLSFSYFIGEKDNFGSGNSFSRIFGSAPILTSYSGFMYFPVGIAYEGIHPLAGTGMQLALLPINNAFYSAFYFYQDANLGKGKYSYDLQMLFNLNTINLEFFAGGSFPVSLYGIYRAGLLFNAQTKGGGIIMELGIPHWNPYQDTLGLSLFYVLFEVNLQLGMLSIIPTVFLHPGYYAQKETDEAGIIDFNLNLKLSDIKKSLVAGGVEAKLSIEGEQISDFSVRAASYLTLFSPGLEWEFKVNALVYPMPPLVQMFEGLIGVKAIF